MAYSSCRMVGLTCPTEIGQPDFEKLGVLIPVIKRRCSEEDPDVAGMCALRLAASARDVPRRDLLTSLEDGTANPRALVAREGHLVAATTECHDVYRDF